MYLFLIVLFFYVFVYILYLYMTFSNILFLNRNNILKCFLLIILIGSRFIQRPII